MSINIVTRTLCVRFVLVTYRRNGVADEEERDNGVECRVDDIERYFRKCFSHIIRTNSNNLSLIFSTVITM